MPKWIPVTERLPDEEWRYLVHCPSADSDSPLIAIAWYEPGVWLVGPLWPIYVSYLNEKRITMNSVSEYVLARVMKFIPDLTISCGHRGTHLEYWRNGVKTRTDWVEIIVNLQGRSLEIACREMASKIIFLCLEEGTRPPCELCVLTEEIVGIVPASAALPNVRSLEFYGAAISKRKIGWNESKKIWDEIMNPTQMENSSMEFDMAALEKIQDAIIHIYEFTGNPAEVAAYLEKPPKPPEPVTRSQPANLEKPVETTVKDLYMSVLAEVMHGQFVDESTNRALESLNELVKRAKGNT